MAGTVWIFATLLVKFLAVSGEPQVDPPSRIIETVNADNYEFGFDEFGDTLISRCYYENDQHVTGQFVVGVQPGVVPPGVRLFENVITNQGSDGLCKITVSFVTEDGPRWWKLAAFDELSGTFFNETFTVTFYHRAKIVKNEIRLAEGAGLFNYLIFGAEQSLSKCTVKFNSTEVELNTKRAERPVITPGYESTLGRMSSLGRGLCGFQLLDVSRAFELNVRWTLTAIDTSNVHYREQFVTRINVKTSETNQHYQVNVVLGEQYKLNCYFPITASFCSIFDLNGNLASLSCTHIIDNVLRQHLGVWRCVRAGQAESEGVAGLEVTYELIESNQEVVNEWYSDADPEYVNIGCRIASPKSGHDNIQHCKFVSPTYKLFDVKNGAASERYMSLGTNTTAATCSLYIKKPLLKSEIGNWRCEIAATTAVNFSTVIKIGEAAEDYQQLIEQTVLYDKPTTIVCQVPYYSDYCTITAPNGTIIRVEDPYSIRLGRCLYHISSVNVTDVGTWTCRFGQPVTGQPDNVVWVHLQAARTLHRPSSVEIDSGGNARVVCTTGSLALKYCRFVAPTGVGYLVRDGDSNSERVKYYGRGLRLGDCGITVDDVRIEEAGSWTCETELFGEQYSGTVREQVLVEVVPRSGLTSSSAGSVGVGLGVALMAIVVFGGAFYWVRKVRRRRQMSMGVQDSGDNSPSDSPRTSNPRNNNEMELFDMRHHRA